MLVLCFDTVGLALGSTKGIWPVKTLCWYSGDDLTGARCRWFAHSRVPVGHHCHHFDSLILANPDCRGILAVWQVKVCSVIVYQ